MCREYQQQREKFSSIWLAALKRSMSLRIQARLRSPAIVSPQDTVSDKCLNSSGPFPESLYVVLVKFEMPGGLHRHHDATTKLTCDQIMVT